MKDSDELEVDTICRLALVARALMLQRLPAPKRMNFDLIVLSSRFSFSKRPAASQENKDHRILERIPQFLGIVKLFMDEYSK